RDGLGDDLEDDPEVCPDDAADQELRRERVLLGLRDVDAARDEDDRQRVGDRPEQERDVPEQVALRQVEVALDDAGEPDQLVPDRLRARQRCAHYANTSRSLSSSVSSSNVRPVAAKKASSRVSTPKRSFTSSTGSRKSRRPRSSRPTRSASASASPMSCVHSRIVASCSARTSRMNSCTSTFERASSPVVASSTT